jgi:hypothetical protein
MKEIIVYVINVDEIEGDYLKLTNDKFIEEAINQGTVYTIDNFVIAFNNEDINTFTQVIRIL